MSGKILPPLPPRKYPEGHSKHAPDPGYDKPAVIVEKIKMDQPKYPADFKPGGSLRVGPTGKQFEKSEKYK